MNYLRFLFPCFFTPLSSPMKLQPSHPPYPPHLHTSSSCTSSSKSPPLPPSPPTGPLPRLPNGPSSLSETRQIIQCNRCDRSYPRYNPLNPPPVYNQYDLRAPLRTGLPQFSDATDATSATPSVYGFIPKFSLHITKIF